MREFIKTVYQVCLAIAVLVVTLFSLDYYVESKVNSAINDPETLLKVASNLRPSLIFTLDGSIEYDLGASQMLTEPPKVLKTQQEGHTPIWEVTVSPKRSLKIAPLVECINKLYNVKGERSIGNAWLFKIEAVEHTLWTKPDIITEPLFRMEIIN